MQIRTRLDPLVDSLGLINFVVCLTGAIATMAVGLIRLPALATSRFEVLFGTLLITAVCLLFGIVGLLVFLTIMVRRATRPQADPRGWKIEERSRSLA